MAYPGMALAQWETEQFGIYQIKNYKFYEGVFGKDLKENVNHFILKHYSFLQLRFPNSYAFLQLSLEEFWQKNLVQEDVL